MIVQFQYMEAQTVAVAFATSLCEGIDPTTCMPTQHAAPLPRVHQQRRNENPLTYHQANQM